MKKTRYKKPYFNAIKKRIKRELKNKKKKKYIRQIKSGYSPKVSTQFGTGIWLKAPSRICIYKKERQKKLVDFLSRLRKETLLHKNTVYIDLSFVKTCGASGTLLFLSEIDRIFSISQSKNIIKGKGKLNDNISQVFKQVGLDKKLSINCSSEVTRDDVKYWQHITDIGTTGEKAGKMLEQLKKDIGDEVMTEIYGAYVDAIDNVSGHAYAEDRFANDQYSEKRWWVFAQIREGIFVTAVCDLGMGIPRSLPTKGFMETLSKTFNKVGVSLSDQQLIKAAFDLDRTRTAQKKHGKGLIKMRKLIETTNDACLSIYSNSGVYRYRKDAAGNSDEQLSSASNIRGTIVEWQIPITL